MQLCEAVNSFGFCTALACMLYIPGPMGRFRWFLSLGEDIPGPTSVHPRHWFTLTKHFFMADWEVIFPNCLLQSTATMLSDHCLLLLGLHDNPSMKRWFHLESFWTDLDGFIDASRLLGNSQHIVCAWLSVHQIQAPERALQSWSQCRVGNIKGMLGFLAQYCGALPS